MARYFKPGDKVQLKSGGPVMTVLKYIEEKEALVGTIESDEFVECEWFEKGTPHRGVFNQNAVVKVENPKKSAKEGKDTGTSSLYHVFRGMMDHDNGEEHASTLSEAIQYLRKRGYRSEFIAGPEGLTEVNTKKHYRPEDLKIVKVFRFEGNTDLDDMSVLYAIESNDGQKGWLADAYGVYANSYLQDYIDRIELERDIKG